MFNFYYFFFLMFLKQFTMLSSAQNHCFQLAEQCLHSTRNCRVENRNTKKGPNEMKKKKKVLFPIFFLWTNSKALKQKFLYFASGETKKL